MFHKGLVQIQSETNGMPGRYMYIKTWKVENHHCVHNHNHVHNHET